MLTCLEHGRCSIHGTHDAHIFWLETSCDDRHCMDENYTYMYECTKWGPVSGFCCDTLECVCAMIAEKFMFPLGQTALHCKCQFYVTTVDGRAGGIGIAA
jgi:hypothetical protein